MELEELDMASFLMGRNRHDGEYQPDVSVRDQGYRRALVVDEHLTVIVAQMEIERQHTLATMLNRHVVEHLVGRVVHIVQHRLLLLGHVGMKEVIPHPQHRVGCLAAKKCWAVRHVEEVPFVEINDVNTLVGGPRKRLYCLHARLHPLIVGIGNALKAAVHC